MISRIFYYFFIIPISLLPHSFLYIISDVLYLLIFRILSYRKMIVFENLKNSFPKRSKDDLKNIMSKFYHHLCDLIVESLKGFTISENELKKRLIVRNPELVNTYAENGQSIILVGAHYNNWEIVAQTLGIYSKHKCIGIYKPLSNKFLNKKIYESRSKFGMGLVSMKESKSSFIDDGIPKAVIFGSDQNPSNPKKAYWLKFLNQDTGVLFGAEKYSKDNNWPVIYATINKIKRGFYEVVYSLVTNNPKDEPYGKITEDFTKLIENDIVNNPQYWLWSHKRWKHKR
ncbi:MAG: lysophospholipid acyltransferase family protein [Flavobacteriales bacterium]|nr:lysophospholipid acyltransferase family protein [Flavobacteriales bacterium]